MKVVLDTSVLVSALWSPSGRPAQVLSLLLNGDITACYDFRILDEYRKVLSRPKFCFTEAEVSDLIRFIDGNGLSVLARPLNVDFIDDSDKKFYEVAKSCGAILVSGNLKHFPQEEWIMGVTDFLQEYFGL